MPELESSQSTAHCRSTSHSILHTAQSSQSTAHCTDKPVNTAHCTASQVEPVNCTLKPGLCTVLTELCTSLCSIQPTANYILPSNLEPSVNEIIVNPLELGQDRRHDCDLKHRIPQRRAHMGKALLFSCSLARMQADLGEIVSLL